MPQGRGCYSGAGLRYTVGSPTLCILQQYNSSSTTLASGIGKIQQYRHKMRFIFIVTFTTSLLTNRSEATTVISSSVGNP